jgi:hypothetical protein
VRRRSDDEGDVVTTLGSRTATIHNSCMNPGVFHIVSAARLAAQILNGDKLVLYELEIGGRNPDSEDCECYINIWMNNSLDYSVVHQPELLLAIRAVADHLERANPLGSEGFTLDYDAIHGMFGRAFKVIQSKAIKHRDRLNEELKRLQDDWLNETVARIDDGKATSTKRPVNRKSKDS